MTMADITALIADDDRDTSRLLSEYLMSLRLKVDVADDGKRALELLDRKRYDFVFLDCNMPEATGLEIAKSLKARIPRPKITMMTGYDPIDEAFAKAAGVDIYIKKPLLLDEVKKIIRGQDGK
jgi:DNA-binding response OmpR family regulator